MLKFENTAQIGDTIKAHDFDPKMLASMGETPKYIAGKVVAKGMIKHPVHGFDMYYGYTIDITEDSAGGHRVGDQGYVAFETDFMEYDNRVELVGE